MGKTLYKTILDAIEGWTKEQNKKTHIQFIMGTLDRVKYDFYHQTYGIAFTGDLMLKLLPGSNFEFEDDGSVVIDKRKHKKEGDE